MIMNLKINIQSILGGSLADASQEIFWAIKNKMPLAYSAKRWQAVVNMINIMPDDLYNALGGL